MSSTGRTGCCAHSHLQFWGMDLHMVKKGHKMDNVEAYKDCMGTRSTATVLQ